MILVTGSTGLVGTHLLLELAKKHDKIRATHRVTSNLRTVYDTFALYVDDPGTYYDKIEWIEADIEKEYAEKEAKNKKQPEEEVSEE